MLIVETVVRIRREHAAGKAIKAIARDLRLSRKVVRKAIRSPEAAFNYQRKVQPLPRIGPYQDRLDVLLEENEGCGRRDRLRMTRIHDLLVREGFEGSYDAVRRYAARWRTARRKDAGEGAPAFIPMTFQPGEAYQFDSHGALRSKGVSLRHASSFLSCFFGIHGLSQTAELASFQDRFKLTYGRRWERLHHYPACVTALAQENETILELGL